MATLKDEEVKRAVEAREFLLGQIDRKKHELAMLESTLQFLDIVIKGASFRMAADTAKEQPAPPPAKPAPTAASVVAAAVASASVPPKIPAAPSMPASSPPAAPAPAMAGPPAVAKPSVPPAAVAASAPPAPSAPQQPSAPAPAAAKPASVVPEQKPLAKNQTFLDRAKDNMHLATFAIEDGIAVITPIDGLVFKTTTPPFQSFLIERVFGGMRNKDVEKAVPPNLQFEVQVLESPDNVLDTIIIKNPGDQSRQQEIRNTAAWVFTRMLEKQQGS